MHPSLDAHTADRRSFDLAASSIHNLVPSTPQIVNSLSFEDDRKQAAVAVTSFVRRVDFGNDLEQHLRYQIVHPP